MAGNSRQVLVHAAIWEMLDLFLASSLLYGGWPISPIFDFEFLPRGEHGEGGQGSLFVNAILPGKDQDDDLGPRHCGIPQENLPRVARSFFLHSPPLAYDF